MSLQRGFRQGTQDCCGWLEGFRLHPPSDLTPDEHDRALMLPRKESKNDSDGDEIEAPVTPWLQPLEDVGSCDVSSRERDGGGLLYSGQHLLDTNGGIWEEPAAAGSPLSGAYDNTSRLQSDSSSQGTSESFISPTARPTSPSAAQAVPNIAARRSALMHPRSMETVASGKDRKPWLSDERRSRSYDHLFGFLKTALGGSNRGNGSNREGESNGGNGHSPDADSSLRGLDGTRRGLDSSGRGVDMSGRGLDTSGKHLRLDMSGRGMLRSNSDGPRALRMDLDSSTHGGRLDPDALARGMRSGASGGMGPVGGSDCDEPLSPKAAPAKSLLSKIKSSLALLPSFPFARGPDPQFEFDEFSPSSPPTAPLSGPVASGLVLQRTVELDRASSGPVGAAAERRRGHSLDNKSAGTARPTLGAAGGADRLGSARGGGGSLEHLPGQRLSRGRSLDLRRPMVLDVSADVLRKASAQVERRRASLHRRSDSQHLWNTSPAMRTTDGLDGLLQRNGSSSTPRGGGTPTPRDVPTELGWHRSTELGPRNSMGLGRGEARNSMGGSMGRSSMGGLRVLSQASRNNPNAQSWSAEPRTTPLPDMRAIRRGLSLDLVRRAYVQSRENNPLAGYATVLRRTNEDGRRSMQLERRNVAGSGSLTPSRHSLGSRPDAFAEGGEDAEEEVKHYTPRLKDGSVPFHPNDATRMLWDALMFVCTIYALIVDPISLAFIGEIPRWSFLNISDRVVTAVFMLDIIMNFLTGYIDKQNMKVVMHWRVVAVQYSKFWLWVDFASSLPPEAFAAMAAATGGSDFTDNNNLLRAARISKILRCFKVSRLARLVERFQLNFDIRISHFAWKISAWVCACFLYLHWTTCAECWVWVFADSTRREIDLGHYGDMLGGEDDCLSWSLCNARYYLRGLRTAIAFMCGHGQETNTSLPEDVIAVICSLLGSILYSSFIAVAISLLMEMDAERVQYMGKVERLNHYMGRRKVPLGLRRRVREYMETTWRQGGGDDVEVLSMVSRSLRREMVMHNFQDVLRNIPFFKSGTPGFMACLGGLLRPESFMKGEKIMIRGEIGQEMFILERGFVRVVAEGFEDEVENDLLDEEDDELGQSLVGLLTPGAYFGEVALVEKTLRTATIIAATAGVVLVLDRDQYEERIVRYFPDIAREVERSAREMIKEHTRSSIEMFGMRHSFGDEPGGGAAGVDDARQNVTGRIWRRLSDVHEDMQEASSGMDEDGVEGGASSRHSLGASSHGAPLKHSVSGKGASSEESSSGITKANSTRRKSGEEEDGPQRKRLISGAVDVEHLLNDLGEKEKEEVIDCFEAFGNGDLLEKPSKRSPENSIHRGTLPLARSHSPVALGQHPSGGTVPGGEASPELSAAAKSVSRSGSLLSRSRLNSQAEAESAERLFGQLSSELGDKEKEAIIDCFEAFGNGDLVEKPRGRTAELSRTPSRSGSSDHGERKRKGSKKGLPLV